jgi:predicted ATPase
VLVNHGRLGDATGVIRDALDRSTAKNERWCRPELLRIQASILTAEGQTAKAEAVLVESIALAQDIGAVSWRLRAACDLARSWSAGARAGDAHAMLSAVYAELTEGFATRDLVVAAELLASFTDPR